MWSRMRIFWTLVAVCLSGGLVMSTAQPAGAAPYSKKAIYDNINLCPTPISVGPHFHFSQTGDIVYQTQVWSGGLWVYALYLYHHSGSVTQIPSGTWQKFDLQINDQGQVVWEEHDMTAKRERIYLYKDGVTTAISGSTYDSYQPRLNNRGQVAYQTHSLSPDTYGISFFDGNASTPINGGNSVNSNQVINDNGQIAWLGANTTDTEFHVYFFDGVNSRQVTMVGNATKVQINQDGWVMWEIGAGGSYIDHYALYLYKGGDPAANTVQLASNINYLSQDPKFGASSQVVWIERQAVSGNDYLWQYLNGATNQVGSTASASFDVNHRGQIAYSADYTIYLHTNHTTTQISPSAGAYGGYVSPIINNNGQIVYFTNDSIYNSQDTVYVYNGGIVKLDGPHTFGYDRDLQLIDNGQIAWFERVTAYLTQPDEARIWLARRLNITPAVNQLLQ
jgi:hypothetical protein